MDSYRLLSSKATVSTTALASTCLQQQYTDKDSRMEVHRPSMVVSTATPASFSIIRKDFPLIDFDAHDFDVGEFTATVSLSRGLTNSRWSVFFALNLFPFSIMLRLMDMVDELNLSPKNLYPLQTL